MFVASLAENVRRTTPASYPAQTARTSIVCWYLFPTGGTRCPSLRSRMIGVCSVHACDHAGSWCFSPLFRCTLPTLQGVKEGDFSMLKERCAGADSGNNAGKSVTKVEGDVDATRAYGRKGQEKNPEHVRGAERKPTTPPIKTGHAAMVQVRQDFRQPVTSLWQTASERAATAPTRAASGGGGIVDSTNTTTARRGLSHRRPQSQAGVSRTQGKGTSAAAAPTSATTNARDDQLGNARPHTGGKSAVPSAGDGRKSNSRGQASRESEPTSSPGISPGPVCVSGGREADAQQHQRGRRTPIPLRSSHRVGPVGSLGEN